MTQGVARRGFDDSSRSTSDRKRGKENRSGEHRASSADFEEAVSRLCDAARRIGRCLKGRDDSRIRARESTMRMRSAPRLRSADSTRERYWAERRTQTGRDALGESKRRAESDHPDQGAVKRTQRATARRFFAHGRTGRETGR